MFLSHKLVEAAQTKTIIILLNIDFNKRGRTPERTPNCSNFRMLHSTNVCHDATQHLWLVPLADSWGPLH